MNLTTNNNDTELKNNCKKLLLENTKAIFDLYKELPSFGWYQYNKGKTSLDKPNVGGSLGEMIYSSEDPAYHQQQKIIEYLNKFDPYLLIKAFGEDTEIAIYNDGDIELNRITY
jgi:hypothetical protein